jgi:hypothetical protein
MKRIAQLPLAEGTNAFRNCSRARISSPFTQRCLHNSPPNPATVAPITASGPPPTAPVPSAEHVDSRVARRRKQADLLKRGQDMRAIAGGAGGGSAKHKRFWKDVHVKHTDGMDSIQVLNHFFYLFCRARAKELIYRRSPGSLGHTPPPPPIKSHPHSPPPQTTPRIRHRPRMGPLGVRPTSTQTPPYPNDLPRLPRPRHRR